jgi:hypothetical protein
MLRFVGLQKAADAAPRVSIDFYGRLRIAFCYNHEAFDETKPYTVQ